MGGSDVFEAGDAFEPAAGVLIASRNGAAREKHRDWYRGCKREARDAAAKVGVRGTL